MGDEAAGQSAKEQSEGLRVIASQVRSHFAQLGESADLFRFIQRGKAPNCWYGLFGPQAERIARDFLHSTTCIVELGTPKDPFQSIPIREQLFLEIARELVLNRSMKLELWERDGERWNCLVKASPGRLEQFEARFGSFQSDGTSREMGCVCAAQWKTLPDGRLQFGCAYVNSLLRTIGFAEFSDTPQCNNFESFLLQIGARECLYPAAAGKSADAVSLGKVGDVLRKLHVMPEELKPAQFQPTGVEQALDTVLRDLTEKVDIMRAQEVHGALRAVMSFLELTKDACNESAYRVRKVDLSKYMRLDQAAMLALNLLQTEPDSVHRAKSSILAFLDECKTGMGSRQLRVWLTQPLLDVDELRRRHDFVDIISSDKELLDAVRGALKESPDVDKILKRLQRKRASVSDCIRIGDFASVVTKVKHTFQMWADRFAGHALMGRATALLKRFNDISEVFENLKELLSQSIEEDESDRTLRIKPCFDDSLGELAAEKEQIAKALNKEYRKVADRLSLTEKTLQFQKHPTHGMSLRVTKAQVKAVESHKELTKLGQLSGASWYTTDALMQLNRQLNAARAKYEERQQSLCEMLMETVTSYSEPLDEAVALVTELDIFSAFAWVVWQGRSKGNSWVRPEVVTDAPQPVIDLQAARHPLVEHQLFSRGGEERFIPNSLQLGGGRANLALITGPNMGGKSTFIRTAGVCVLLSQVGMFSPADGMRLSLCDGLLARLGATDYMSRGVSTFMAEMLETAAILSTATSASFVMIDELGRGTSTHDGFGLAWGITEHIAKQIRCRCLFATHFHELTDMEDVHPEVTNLSVTADTSGERLKMLYEVRPHPCSKSFGINVAQMTKFPEQVISMAKRKAEELELAADRARKRQRNDSPPESHRSEQEGLRLAATDFLVDWLKQVDKTLEQGGADQGALRELGRRFELKAQELPALRGLAAEHAAAP